MNIDCFGLTCWRLREIFVNYLLFWNIHIVVLLIHSAVCLMTGPMPPPKRFLHIVWFKASSSRRVSSPFPKVIQQLLTSSASSSCHFHLSLYLSFSILSYKAVYTQYVTNPVSSYLMKIFWDTVSILAVTDSQVMCFGGVWLKIKCM